MQSLVDFENSFRRFSPIIIKKWKCKEAIYLTNTVNSCCNCEYNICFRLTSQQLNVLTVRLGVLQRHKY